MHSDAWYSSKGVGEIERMGRASPYRVWRKARRYENHVEALRVARRSHTFSACYRNAIAA